MPNDADVPANLVEGRLSYRQKRWSDAFTELSQADETSPLGVEDLEALAWAAGLSGRDDDHLRLFERVYNHHAKAGDCAAASRWAFWIGFRLLSLAEPARASGWLARSQRLCDESGQDSAVRGFLLFPAMRRNLVSGDHTAAFDTASEAARIGERFAEPDVVNYARSMQGRVRVEQGNIEEGLCYLDEVMVAATAGELSPVIAGIVYCIAIESCHRAFAVDRAREWTQAFADWCDAQPQLAPFGGTCLVHRSQILQLGGDWTKAMEEARRAATQAPTRVQSAAGEAFYQEGEIHRLLGALAAAEDAYRSANDHGSDPQPGLALLRLAQGRSDVALTAIRRVVGSALAPLQRARFLPASVEIHLAVGDIDGARKGSQELDEIARTFDVEVLAAMAAHARGAICLAEGDAQGALSPLRQAFEIWQKVGAPYLAARVRVSLSRACRVLGDDDGAELALSAARQVFERLGAATDLAALDAAGTRDDDGPVSHGLSVRELEVLKLLATGMTNKAIAQSLFLSEKTVDRHVSNIFTKTDVTSRAGATAFAYERGIVRPSRAPHG